MQSFSTKALAGGDMPYLTHLDALKLDMSGGAHTDARGATRCGDAGVHVEAECEGCAGVRTDMSR